MLDNALNNNTVIKAITKAFRFDPIKRRLRCLGHIINLIAHHLLFGFDPDLFEVEEVLPTLLLYILERQSGLFSSIKARWRTPVTLLRYWQIATDCRGLRLCDANSV